MRNKDFVTFATIVAIVSSFGLLDACSRNAESKEEQICTFNDKGAGVYVGTCSGFSRYPMIAGEAIAEFMKVHPDLRVVAVDIGIGAVNGYVSGILVVTEKR